MLINLNASPASKTFLRSQILPTLCTKLLLTSRLTLQIMASIDSTGVLLQIRGRSRISVGASARFFPNGYTGREVGCWIHNSRQRSVPVMVCLLELKKALPGFHCVKATLKH